MLRWIYALAMVLTFASATNASPASPVPLEQRLAAARAEVAKADAQEPPKPVAQAAAIERLFDLLDEASQLESDAAKKLVDRDLALHPASDDEVAYALALERNARVQYAHRRLGDALSIAQQALTIARAQQGDHGKAEASIRATIGAVLAVQYKYADAIPYLEAAVAGFDAHQVVNAQMVFTLQSLALADEKLGKKEPARKALERATAVASTLEGADSGLVGGALSIAADFQDDAGDYAGAVGTHEHALALLRDTRPPRPALYSSARTLFAWTLLASGKLDRAGKLFHEGIAAEEPNPTLGGATLASTYYGYGYYLRFTEHYEESAAFLRLALALARKIYGADADGPVFIEKVLAKDLRDTGDYGEAIPLLQHAVAVTDRAPAGSYAGGDAVRAELGDIYVWQGRYAEAEQLFRSYIARLGPGHDLGKSHPRGALEGLAASLWAQGRGAEAFAAAVATERSQQKVLRTAGADLSEQHGVDFKQFQRGGLDWVVAIAAKSAKPEQVAEAWDVATVSHGLIGTISARRIAVARAATDPKLATIWKTWKRRNEVLVQARLTAARNPGQATSDALDAAEQSFDDAERTLAHAEGSNGVALKNAQADLRSVLAVLPSDTLLVSYVDVNCSEPEDLDQPMAKRHGRLYAFVAAHGVPPKLLDLGPRLAIRDATKKWLTLLTDRHADASVREATGAQLRTMIWDPIAKSRPQQHVLIVASPTLDRVPFAALPAQDGRFLVETGYAFHLLDHERDALAIPTRTAAATLSLIGAPDFGVDTRLADNGTRGVCAGLRGATFSPLPQAAREIGELDSLWKQQAGATTPTVLTGDDANEARARAVLHGSRIIHFATHAVYLGDQCNQAPSDTRGIRTVETATTPQAVRDLSALVLTGANRPATSTENDGLLTSEEVATLDLTGTDWAVLSACDTGVGKDISGEGVFGLRRAFRLAGVHSVIMSLWPVSDAASADWMLALYRARLQQHASTIDSVRTADLALIKQRRDAGLDPAPYYWAAFVAAGDWR